LRVINVLFVCLGNICRSPSAEVVFRAAVDRDGRTGTIAVDSAGITSWNVGLAADLRARREAARRGFDLSEKRARQVEARDFRRFDYLLAMDRRNHADLLARCPPDLRDRLALFLDFAPEAGVREVVDPYHGGADDFARMFDLLEIGARGLLAHLRRTHGD
jgi:protein-tyrosine phosphatase